MLGGNGTTRKIDALLVCCLSEITAHVEAHKDRLFKAEIDVANLLRTGQSQRALLWVERVIKERNMIDVLLMLLRIIRILTEILPKIKTNKYCPNELREAVASLVYAAPRCGECPALLRLASLLIPKFMKHSFNSASEANQKDVNPGSGRTQQRMSAEMAATETALRCPRCDSTNTKFCYYNNYSKLQPRHYCRACRRHWTAGGTLRSVPVGGSRKNKRLKTDRTASAEKEYDSTTSERNISPIESSTKDLPLRQCENNRGGGELGTQPWMPCGEPESTWWLYQDTACLPFASFSSSSCSASLYDHSDDGLFAMQSSTRQPPSSNLSHWDDILDLVNLELKAPAPERLDQTLSY